MISEIDISTRRFLSVLFRVLILGYCLTILLRFNNIFEWYFYLILFIVYFSTYFMCYGEDGKYGFKPLIRLFNDYGLFYFILYGKTLEDPHSFVLLLLPIINALNHSSKKRSGAYSIPLYLFALTTYYLLNDYRLSWGIVVCVISLSIINVFLNSRVSILNYVDRLNSTFEDYNIGPEETRKPYMLLLNIIRKFNELPIGLRYILFSPKTILCIRIRKNKLLIKSSTDFVFTPFIENHEELIEKLKSNLVVFNHKVTLDGIDNSFNAFIKVTVNSNQYVFLFIFDKNEESWINVYFVRKFLISALTKVARILDYENTVKTERRRLLIQYKSKIKMLEDTRDTLHLVKNKLGPVYTYFDLLERQEKKGTDYTEQLNKSRARIASNLKMIKDKSTPYLENLNILSHSEIENGIKLKNLFSFIMDCFQEEMESEFKLKIGSTVGINRVAKINLESLYFLLSEIAMNVDEHSIKDSAIISFSFENDLVLLSVKNKIKNLKDKAKISTLFNKDDISLALEKNFNGLTILKKYLLRLQIEHSLLIDDDSFNLELKIKTYESSDI